MKRLWRAVPRLWFQLAAAAFLLTVVAAAVLAPWLSPHDPNKQSISARLMPPAWQGGGSTEYLLGTDELGRDVLSRLLHGARTSVLIGVGVVLVTAVLGVAIGTLAGYVGGKFDAVVRWLMDTVLSLPGLLISAALVFVLGASVTTVIIALSIEGWLVYCRMARGMVRTSRSMPYVDAATVVGVGLPRLLGRHILPNIVSPLITLSTLEFARIVIAEATLSFLGLGIQPPLVSWGLMINNGGAYLTTAWWLITLPGLALTLTALSANIVANWVRQVSDPLQRSGALLAVAR